MVAGRRRGCRVQKGPRFEGDTGLTDGRWRWEMMTLSVVATLVIAVSDLSGLLLLPQVPA